MKSSLPEKVNLGLNRARGQHGALDADGNHTEDALSNLELMVSVDPYLNEATRFADVILPPAGPLKNNITIFSTTRMTQGNWVTVFARAL